MSKYVKEYEFLTQCLNTIAKEIKFTFKVMPSLANEETVLVTIEGVCNFSSLSLKRYT